MFFHVPMEFLLVFDCALMALPLRALHFHGVHTHCWCIEDAYLINLYYLVCICHANIDGYGRSTLGGQ